MTENYVSYKGERLSFYDLVHRKNWNIEIPIIQRDYAQGRPSAEGIRERFLDTIYDHLINDNNIDLDFVYGSVNIKEESFFVPLDGQQRLTTLFLLHWYLALKEDYHLDFLIDSRNASKLTYETRSSSKEFCDSIVLEGNSSNIKNQISDSGDILSNVIKDCNWFFSTWQDDPTINSMLTMLDAIDEKFKHTQNLFNKLTRENHPLITFMFLNLEQFNLSEDLYIKMNSRGKQLTSFENFKSKLSQFLKEDQSHPNKIIPKHLNGKSNKDIEKYFSYKIDQEWAEVFWFYRDINNMIDDYRMNFIRVLIANHLAVRKDVENKYENLGLLLGEPNIPISFFYYQKIGAIDINIALTLINTLDLLYNSNKKGINIYLPENNYFDEEENFRLALTNFQTKDNKSISYAARVRMFAFYEHLALNGIKGIEDWMRVVYNLSENRAYNESENFVRGMRSINYLLQFSSDIIQFLKTNEKIIDGFQIQSKEEHIKAHLISKGGKWKESIISAEMNNYFNGQILFILNFAGIEDYFDTYQNCDWSSQLDNSYYKKFNDYFEKAESIFSRKENPKLDTRDPQHRNLFRKAVLSKGPYLLNKGKNLSFLTFDKNRDISWKRLLRESNNGKRSFVKDLFDDTRFNSTDSLQSLEAIVENAQVDDWRKYFIETNEMLDYLGTDAYIRCTDTGLIFLLKKTRISGEHVEYFTYEFFLNSISETEIYPFRTRRYKSATSAEEIPYIKLEGLTLNETSYSVEIRNRGFHKLTSFEVRFVPPQTDAQLPDEIRKTLTKLEMHEDTGQYGDNSYIKYIDKEPDLKNFIHLMTDALSSVVK